MSNEANIRCSLSVRGGNVQYNSLPAGFTADITNVRGPTPGLLLASLAGTNVDLSQLTQPGLCRIQNLDETNFVEYGMYDPDLGVTLYLGEILPGESFILRLSRFLGSEMGTATGTSTVGSGGLLRIKAHTAACRILVECFDS